MSAGQWLQQIALSWLVFEMTGSAGLLGLINGVRFLPFLFTSLIGGVLADRMDRRRLMLWTQWYVLAATLAMGLLLLSGRAAVWHLFAFTFISGIGWSLSQPVRQSVLPSLVPRAELLNAVSISSAAFNITRTVGPAIGGFLLATLGGGGTFLVQAVLYAVVLAMTAAMRIPPLAPSPTGSNGSAWQSIREGVHYVRATPIVGSLLLLGLVPMLLGMPYQSLMPIFAADIYRIGPGGLGVLTGVAGLGSVMATVTIAGLGDFPRRGLVQILCLAAFGVALLLFSQVTWLPLALAILVGVGAAQFGYNALNQTQLQTAIADHMRGRVMSLYMLNVGLVPAGSLAAGLMADALGAPTTLALMGALIAGIAALALVRAGAIRRL
jgi:predicted MFS family arabinose efflux permease